MTGAFGAEGFTDGTTMDGVWVRVLNTDTGTGHDAVGLKANNAVDVVFRNAEVSAEAETNVWGIDITGGSDRLARVDARAQGIPGNLAYGTRSFSGSVEVTDSNLAAAADNSTYGLFSFDCTTSRVVDTTTFCDTGATNSYGLYLFNNLPTPGVHTVRGGVYEGAITVSSWNDATVDVVDATLVGGSGQAAGISTQTCVGVVYDSGGSPAFDAGPTSPCP